MKTKSIEISVIGPENVKELVVVKSLAITTQKVSLALCESIFNDKTYGVPLYKDYNRYFVSMAFDPTLKVNVRGKQRDIGSLKPKVQYDIIRYKLQEHANIICTEGEIEEMTIIFEATKSGNIHFHAVLFSQSCKKLIQTLFCDAFGITKYEKQIVSCDVGVVQDSNKIINYLFDKTNFYPTKAYEILDQTKYKPLIMISDDEYFGTQ